MARHTAILSLGVLLGSLGLFLLGLVVARSCRPAPTTAGAPPRANLAPYRFSVDELSALGAYLADLDDGRLRVAPPVDWHLTPRSRDYITRFVLYPKVQPHLPRITVEARDAHHAPASTSTEMDLRHSLEQLARSVEESDLRAREIQLLVLGDVPCVKYILNLTFRVGEHSYRGEREVLATLAHGRLYTVSLDVYAGKLAEYRADAYAVLAGLQFVSPPASVPGGFSGCRRFPKSAGADARYCVSLASVSGLLSDCLPKPSTAPARIARCWCSGKFVTSITGTERSVSFCLSCSMKRIPSERS